jgi:hypothetical protein
VASPGSKFETRGKRKRSVKANLLDSSRLRPSFMAPIEDPLEYSKRGEAERR